MLDLKSKLLQEEQEKQELMNKATVEIVPIASQPMDTGELTRSLSQVSLEKRLPHFWGEDNCLLKKEDYDNLMVHKRNDHS